MVDAMTPQGPIHHESSPGKKWFLIIIFGIIVILGLAVAGYYFTSEDQHGVAVVRMEGTMVTGQINDGDSIGSEVVGNALRNAADDPMTEAIVLRVDSPGGSPAAAEEIIGDLNYAKSKKPVVVSMGDLATSAAYYVSVHADKIYADPDTLTGAVGVIWKFSDISRYNDEQGYNFTDIKSGDFKDMGTSNRPMTPEETAYAQQIVNESFERFINDVTLHRMVSPSVIEDGRVITGEDALKLNLVDQLGNLNDAIEGAKELAESRS
jgi:protease-4